MDSEKTEPEVGHDKQVWLGKDKSSGQNWLDWRYDVIHCDFEIWATTLLLLPLLLAFTLLCRPFLFMGTSLAESRDNLLQAIDDEIIISEESTRALRSRRNALAPVSRLPPETLAAIFFFLSPPATFFTSLHFNRYGCFNDYGHLAWMCVAHVCHQWRETALNHPRLWSHINFTRSTVKLTPVAMAEILARTKMEPLHIEAGVSNFSAAQLDAFERQLDVHISHTRHLSIDGLFQSALNRLVLPAPILEFLSLGGIFLQTRIVIPINLFNCTAPSLTSLELKYCDICWKSPLLKGLRTLKIHGPSTEARPGLDDWLNALNGMPQLETLFLANATPLAPLAAPLISDLPLAVTLPSLTRFRISAFARDCALAFAHLVLPALTWLHVDVISHDAGGEDVRLVIPYVARNVSGLRDTEPLRKLLIGGFRTRVMMDAWTMPDADINFCDTNLSFTATAFVERDSVKWLRGVDAAIFDSLLTLLPVNSVSTLIAHNHTRFSKEFWLNQAPRLPLLEQARLIPTAVKAFRDMLAEDAPPDGPRLPLLTKLALVEVKLTPVRAFHLRDMLMERVEQGVPLEVLDLRLCVAAGRAIQLLNEIVVDVEEPLDARQMTMEDPALFAWNGGTEYCNEVKYDDERSSSSNGDIDGYDDGAEYSDDYVYDDYDGLYDGLSDDVQLPVGAEDYSYDYSYL